MKDRKSKTKRYSVCLSEGELKRLSAYAAREGVARSAALRRIVKSFLHNYCIEVSTTAKNQIGLFDTLQIDIFNQASVLRADEPIEKGKRE
ncbi:MAG: hypothetical protein IJ761_07545 [Bacteroidales bacterium]|nr:hypothetical protein [Bacteroidales bacterium]